MDAALVLAVCAIAVATVNPGHLAPMSWGVRRVAVWQAWTAMTLVAFALLAVADAMTDLF